MERKNNGICTGATKKNEEKRRGEKSSTHYKRSLLHCTSTTHWNERNCTDDGITGAYTPDTRFCCGVVATEFSSHKAPVTCVLILTTHKRLVAEVPESPHATASQGSHCAKKH